MASLPQQSLAGRKAQLPCSSHTLCPLESCLPACALGGRPNVLRPHVTLDWEVELSLSSSVGEGGVDARGSGSAC